MSFESDAVNTAQRTVSRFAQRLADADTMADTVAINSHDEILLLSKQNAELRKDNAALVARIEALEATRPVVQEAHDTLARIAYVLRTFYFAELSLSTLQPLMALAIELNPQIVEQRR
jgi:cell division protein FtsB